MYILWIFIKKLNFDSGTYSAFLHPEFTRSTQISPFSSLKQGADAKGHPLTITPMSSFEAHYSDIDWAYSTVPQVHLTNRICYSPARKALSGGTATNYGT
jgi:hypothetical protein